jgi:hypothetical protein
MYIPTLLSGDVSRHKTRGGRVATVGDREQELRHEKDVISEGMVSESEE